MFLPANEKTKSVLIASFSETWGAAESMAESAVPLEIASVESPTRDTASDVSLEEPQLDIDHSMKLVAAISTNAEPRQVSPSLSQMVRIATDPKPVTSDVSGKSHLFANASLKGRDLEGRRELALRNGGSEASEAAVEAALRWLRAHQASDGSWSMDMNDAPCKGKCTHGTNEMGSPKRISATGLAVLSFLGAGYTHRKGEHKEAVQKGLNFLMSSLHMKKQDQRARWIRGRFLQNGGPYEMYEQGIATLALCEAYAMTRDSMLLPSCEGAIDFIQNAQASDGSWGYHPNESGDLSIVGWQAMALKSAAQAEIAIKSNQLERMDRFLETQSTNYGSFYGYRSKDREPGTTAIGLLIRLFRGTSFTDTGLLRGADYLAELGPSIDGIYYNYYATQVLFHMKHPSWDGWNRQCRDYLIREQSQDGHEAGSWNFGRNTFNKIGGRLYCTTMAVLTLEVYYRYSPIYKEIEPDQFQL